MADKILRFDIEANSDAARRAVADLRREFDTTLAALKKQQGDIAIFKAAQRDAAALEKQIKSLSRAGGDTTALNAALAAQRATLAQLSASLQKAGIDTNSLSSAQARLRGQVEQVKRNFVAQAQSVNDELGNVERKSAGMGNALSGLFSKLAFQLGTVLGVGKIAAMADEYNNLQARLKLASRNSDEFAAANTDVVQISSAARVPLAQTAELYVRIASSVKDLGVAQRDVAGVTEAVALSLKLSGASAAESGAAMLQFSQAVASGVLRGDEFNSVNEAAPRLLQGLAKSLGVPVGQLREMAQAGQLTRDVLIDGLLKDLPNLRNEAASLPDTIGGAFTNLGNQLRIVIGQFDQATGASKGLAGVINGIGSTGIEALAVVGANVVFVFHGIGREIGGVAAQFAALLRGDFKGFRFIGDQIKADGEKARKELDAFEKRVLEGGKAIVNSTEKTTQATAAATVAVAASVKQQTKDRKEAVNEQIKDAERLRDALIGAYADSLKTEKDYLAQAKRLRAEATATPRDSSVEGQAGATLGLIATEQKLQNIRGTGSLEEVRAQVALVQQLAAGLDDQARATEAVNRAKLAEAAALERAAAGEAEQQVAITKQQKLNDERIGQLQGILKALEGGKTVTLDANVEEARVAVDQVKELWDAIQDKAVTLTVNQTGTAAALPAKASGGLLQGPGTGTSDDILARVSNGEFVLRAAAVKKIGLARLNHLNLYGSLPQFAEGGLVEAARRVVNKQRVDIATAVDAARARYNPPKFAGGGLIASAVGSLPRPADSGGAGGTGQVLNLTLPGVGTFETRASRDVAAELERAVQLLALKSGHRA